MAGWSGSVAAGRATPPLVLAIDIGSSSVRASLYDANGRAVHASTAQLPYAATASADGAVTVDADWLMALVDEVIDQALARSRGATGQRGPERVSYVAISCFLHSLAGIDERGRATGPLTTWADTSGTPEAERLRSLVDPAATWQRVGAPIHPGYWPARILRLRSRGPVPAAWAGFPELLTRRYFGTGTTGQSIAAGTGLYDRTTGGWDRTLSDVLGLDPAWLPTLADDGAPLPPLRDAYRRRWPGIADATWFLPWSDAACSNVGLGGTDASTVVLLLGTSGALRVLVDDPVPHVPDGLFAFRLGRTHTLLGSQLSEGGGVLSWLARALRRSRESLEQSAAALEPGGHRLAVLPFLAGERSPGYDGSRRGVVAGLQLDTTPAQLFLAFQEAIAYRIAAADDRLASALPVRPALVAGGGALRRSPSFVQLIADVLGREIVLPAVREPSSRGAALLALAAARRPGGPTSPAGSEPVPAGRVFLPDAARHEVHTRGRRRHEVLYATG